MQQVLGILVSLATVVGGLAAMSALFQALTRRTLLRHQEAQWRQLLETHLADGMPTHQRHLVRDLHLHVVAQLIGLALIPRKSFGLAGWIVVFAGLLSARAGWLVTEVRAMTPQESWFAQLREVGALQFLVAALLLSFFTLPNSFASLASRQCARNAIMHSVLGSSAVLIPRKFTLHTLHRYHPNLTVESLLNRMWVMGLLLMVAGASLGVSANWTSRALRTGALGVELRLWEALNIPLGLVISWLVTGSGVLIFASFWSSLIRPEPPEIESSAIVISELEIQNPAAPDSDGLLAASNTKFEPNWSSHSGGSIGASGNGNGLLRDTLVAHSLRLFSWIIAAILTWTRWRQSRNLGR